MTTATTLVTHGLGLIGVVDPVEALEADDASFGLSTLNGIVDLMAADALLPVAVAFEPIALTAGNASVTIGLAGTVAVNKPTSIEVGGFIRSGTTDYPLKKITRDEWAHITDKSASGIPFYYTYEPTTAVLGTITFWPVPDGSYTAYLPLKSRLSAFADLTTEYSLPEGWEEYLKTSIAIHLAPSYGREASASVVARMRWAKKLIKRLNTRVPTLSTAELRAIGQPGLAGGGFSVLVGEEIDIY